MQKFLLLAALALGGMITYVDSRPTWDDAGITAGAVFMSCVALGALGPRRPWLWAAAVGLWIPLLAIFRSHNFGTLLALAIAFAGAYAGVALRRLLAPARA
jgi:hypothetical protein